MIKRDIALADNTTALLLYGDLNKNLAVLEEGAGVTIQVRGSQLTVSGPKHEVELTASAIDKLQGLVRAGYPVYPSDVAYALRILQASPKANLKEIFLDKVYITAEQKVISPKSINQKLYIDNIRTNDIVFGIGPAGTGKTYLAVAVGVTMLVGGHVDKIILSRPAVEAGERLGFLPGDMKEKVDPYMQPLYDALNDFLPAKQLAKLMEEKRIEIAPLAFMRGRTLSSAFVVLDEAQNATTMQMKMFLTRLGQGSRMVITGDRTQVDLPRGTASGLQDAERILAGVKGVAFNYFTARDVVRHPLVARVIEAYERDDATAG